MAGRLSGAARGIGQGARRLWPLALEAWRRWDALPDDEKDRYRERARDARERARLAVERMRRRGG